MTNLGDMVSMPETVARQSAVPVEHPRPERLAANSEDYGELCVRDLRRVVVRWWEVGTKEHVSRRSPTVELG